MLTVQSKWKKVVAAYILASAAAVSFAADALAEPPTATDLVAAMDKASNPQQPFRQSVELVEYVGGKARDRVNLSVHAKIDKDTHQFKNLVRYVTPPRDAGKLVLLNGTKMWFYDPASKTSVRISAQQRLTGQASEGDVLTINLANDYSPKILGEEEIQDIQRKQRNVWHVELKASTNAAMYTRLEYWIERETNRPIKAKFYADSGRLLKIAYYGSYEEHLGTVRATEIVLIDAVNSKLVTKIKYSDFRFEAVQDLWFQRDYLPQFKE